MGVDTYYFDTFTSDPTAAWTNDANAFNGSTANHADTTQYGSSKYLKGIGTDAPASGLDIDLVEVRLYGTVAAGNAGIRCNVYDGVASLGFCTNTENGGATWSSYASLSVPAGGWTWAKLQGLETRFYKQNNIGIAQVFRVEIRVTSSVHDTASLILTAETVTTLTSIGPVSANEPHYGSVNLVSGNILIGGSFVRGSISSGGRAVVGDKMFGYVDDFYFRFHLIPWSIDFGYILSTVIEYFILWNAYFVPKVCTAINEINGGEYTLSGLTTPFTLNGLQETIYSVTPVEDGSPTFESTISFDFGMEDTYVIETLTGVRIVLFRWEPKQLITEHLEWLTDIIKAKDGSEQRISVRRVPRQGFNFTVYFDTEKQQIIYETFLHKWQKKKWGLPVWYELVNHSDTINVLDTIITVDTTYTDFRDDSLAVIWKSVNEFEIIRIATVAVGSLSLSSVVQNTYTGDKVIIPCRIAQINRVTRGKETPDGQSTIEFNFVVEDNILLTGYAAGTTYKTLPVLTDASIVGKAQEKISDGDLAITDFNTGEYLIYSDSEFNKVIQSHVFKNYTKVATWNHRLFLHYLLGQLNTVWIPTFKSDMILTNVIGAADTSFTIENIGLYDNMGVNVLRTHIAFIFSDGSMLLREIVNIIEVDNDEETISIDTSLGQTISIGECTISFLDKCRLSSDVVKIDWEHSGWNTNKLNWLRVKA